MRLIIPKILRRYTLIQSDVRHACNVNKRTHSPGHFCHFLSVPPVFIDDTHVAKRIVMFSNDTEMFVTVKRADLEHVGDLHIRDRFLLFAKKANSPCSPLCFV